jgi:hypothetical protein
MTTKTKGRNGGDRPTQNTSSKRNPTPMSSAIKAAILRCATWGVIPANLATWLVKRAGLKDA